MGEETTSSIGEDASSSIWVEVAPLAAVSGLLTYRVKASLASLAQPGSRVLVPLGQQRGVLGVIARRDVGALAIAEDRIKDVTEILDETPALPPDVISLVLWAATYYCAPPGEMVRAALPALLLRQGAGQQRIGLTTAGAEALGAQDALLRRQEYDMTSRQDAFLRRLGGRKGTLSRRVAVREAGAAVLKQVVERGWAEVVIPSHRPRRDLLLERVAGADLPLRSRARSQIALLAQVEAAGGAVRLGELPDRPKEARRVARELEAKGLLRLREVALAHDPFADVPVPEDPNHRLTDAQQVALEVLEDSVRELQRLSSAPLAAAAVAGSGGGFAPFLLHGVTGSGKTEVYLRLIARVLQETGRGAIVLVPEIALTPQLAGRFRARFGGDVAVLHSGLSDSARQDQWRRLRDGSLRIVVGARSAIFAPIVSPGVLIVDEEHDPSFKQGEGVRYNARDMALVRAQGAGAIVVLGSATPSLESRRAVDQGRMALLELPRRATPRPLPRAEIIDLRRYSTAPDGVLSAPLTEAIEAGLAAHEQTILFLNRRGFSPLVQCRACGHVFTCEHCSVSLTHHRRQGRMVCHYCGFSAPTPDRCPSCGGPELQLRGFGTERVEEILVARFPHARVARLDRDTAAGAGMSRILDGLRNRDVDILVGTQMVTKGHDFPHVTLVGVLNADQGLHFPDFRAAERTFQLLTQVAGRAGRGEKSGRVLIQTYSPDHPAILAACAHDYATFCRDELEARRELSYPPWAYLAALHLDGVDGTEVARTAVALGQALGSLAQREAVTILGPAEAPLSRLKGQTRWMLLLKAKTRGPLRRVVEEALSRPRDSGAVRLTVDIDPVQML